jgi:hypothetical protein
MTESRTQNLVRPNLVEEQMQSLRIGLRSRCYRLCPIDRYLSTKTALIPQHSMITTISS